MSLPKVESEAKVLFVLSWRVAQLSGPQDQTNQLKVALRVQGR
jgi:hypothetical protein